MRPVPAQIAARLPAAATLIAERGFDETTIDDLAGAVGVSKATIYYYFTGKEEILSFLLTDMLQRIADTVTIALDGPGDARERLSAVIAAQLAVMADQPSTCRALTAELGRAGRIPRIAAAIRSAYLAPIERLIVEGGKDESLRPVAAPEIAALSVFGAVTVIGLAYAVDGRQLPETEAAEAVTSMILHGLLPATHVDPPGSVHPGGSA